MYLLIYYDAPKHNQKYYIIFHDSIKKKRKPENDQCIVMYIIYTIYIMYDYTLVCRAYLTVYCNGYVKFEINDK